MNERLQARANAAPTVTLPFFLCSLSAFCFFNSFDKWLEMNGIKNNNSKNMREATGFRWHRINTLTRSKLSTFDRFVWRVRSTDSSFNFLVAENICFRFSYFFLVFFCDDWNTWIFIIDTMDVAFFFCFISVNTVGSINIQKVRHIFSLFSADGKDCTYLPLTFSSVSEKCVFHFAHSSQTTLKFPHFIRFVLYVWLVWSGRSHVQFSQWNDYFICISHFIVWPNWINSKRKSFIVCRFAIVRLVHRQKSSSENFEFWILLIYSVAMSVCLPAWIYMCVCSSLSGRTRFYFLVE